MGGRPACDAKAHFRDTGEYGSNKTMSFHVCKLCERAYLTDPAKQPPPTRLVGRKSNYEGHLKICPFRNDHECVP
jgi:hypothetical protein